MRPRAGRVGFIPALSLKESKRDNAHRSGLPGTLGRREAHLGNSRATKNVEPQDSVLSPSKVRILWETRMASSPWLARESPVAFI